MKIALIIRQVVSHGVSRFVCQSCWFRSRLGTTLLTETTDEANL